MKIEDLQTATTAKIVQLLEKGAKPWKPSWSGCGGQPRPLRHNGLPYSGINILILWMTAMERGFASRVWMTYRQATQAGGQVRKGERGTPIIAYSPADPDVEENDPRSRAFARAYYVFNVDQVDGVHTDFDTTSVAAGPDDRAIAAYDLMMAYHSPRYVESVGEAFYVPSTDTVHWPAVGDFVSAEHHFTTACHELCHFSGAQSRLNRPGIVGERTRDAYAFEELIVELGAAFIGATAGVAGEHLDDHASYLASWLRVLRDPRAIFRAASEAQPAANYVFPIELVGRLSQSSVVGRAA